jgi:hypothetical protein
VTLPEKIEEVLRLEELATPGPWEIIPDCAGGKDEAWCYWHRIGKLELPGKHPNNDGVFIAAARNIIRPLAHAYTAALTALEASDSDRKKLKASVAYLEACQRAIFDAGFKAARSMGDNAHHYRSEQADAVFAGAMERLEAELAKAKTDR